MHPGLGKKSCASYVEGRIMEQKHSLCTFWQVFLVDLLQHLKHLPNKTTAVIFSVPYEVSTSQMCSDEYFPHVNNGILKT